MEAEQAALAAAAAAETTQIAGKKPPATPIKEKPGGAVKEKPSDAIVKKLDSVSKLVQEAQVTSAAAAAATEEAHQHAREAQVPEIVVVREIPKLQWHQIPDREKSCDL
jgi:hypothetical protein